MASTKMNHAHMQQILNELANMRQQMDTLQKQLDESPCQQQPMQTLQKLDINNYRNYGNNNNNNPMMSSQRKGGQQQGCQHQQWHWLQQFGGDIQQHKPDGFMKQQPDGQEPHQ